MLDRWRQSKASSLPGGPPVSDSAIIIRIGRSSWWKNCWNFHFFIASSFSSWTPPPPLHSIDFIPRLSSDVKHSEPFFLCSKSRAAFIIINLMSINMIRNDHSKRSQNLFLFFIQDPSFVFVSSLLIHLARESSPACLPHLSRLPFFSRSEKRRSFNVWFNFFIFQDLKNGENSIKFLPKRSLKGEKIRSFWSFLFFPDRANDDQAVNSDIYVNIFLNVVFSLRIMERSWRWWWRQRWCHSMKTFRMRQVGDRRQE